MEGYVLSFDMDENKSNNDQYINPQYKRTNDQGSIYHKITIIYC